MSQQVDTLVQPIVSTNPVVPLVVRCVTSRAGNTMLTSGAPEGGQVINEYVLLSALPQDLKERVITAVRMLAGG